jgi:DNA-binding LacI/PurR family transcriptional regulator
MPKRTILREVAERAGVSRTTVSFVLNDVPGMRISEETRQRVVEAARELNYHPDATARRMTRGKTETVGLVLRQTPDQVSADQFLPQVLNGFSQACAAQNYHMLFETIPPDRPAGSYARLLNERHVDGIALSGPRNDDQELLALSMGQAPIVLMGQLPVSHLPFVDVNNVGGAVQATRHLIEHGHQRIGLITNAPPAYTASADRLTGYRQALEAAGLPFNGDWVRYGDFTWRGGEAAMSELLALTPALTAVFIASDTVALGAIQVIRRSGRRIPDDIAVVGFDDVPMAQFVDPPLTTIRLPAFGLGWGAAELLIRLIMAEEPVRNPQVLLETELIVRASCGCRTVPVA